MDCLSEILLTTNGWIARRSEIRALGNLQQFSGNVARAFFMACQDIDEVYSEARRAVGKFKYFDEESLAILTKAIEHPGIRVAHNAALLLGELGVSRSEELGVKGRQQVAEALLKILDTPSTYNFNSGFQLSSLLYPLLFLLL
jgi:HEAT repeat protein